MNLKSLAKDTALYGLSSIVGRFLNYLLVPVYTYYIAAESGGYGIVTNLYAYTALLLALLTFGMETTLFRFCNKDGEDGKMVYSTILRMVGGVALLFFVLVMVFLGPTMGYRDQLKGFAFYLHVSGPLIAAISFCFLERWYPLSFALSLTGMLPVVLYGALYLNRVVTAKQWEDFYGFNKNGKWQISFSAMVAGSFLLCVILWLLCRL